MGPTEPVARRSLIIYIPLHSAVDSRLGSGSTSTNRQSSGCYDSGKRRILEDLDRFAAQTEAALLPFLLLILHLVFLHKRTSSSIRAGPAWPSTYREQGRSVRVEKANPAKSIRRPIFGGKLSSGLWFAGEMFFPLGSSEAGAMLPG